MANAHFTEGEVLEALRAYHCFTTGDRITYDSQGIAPIGSSASFGVIPDINKVYNHLKHMLTPSTSTAPIAKIPAIKEVRSIFGTGLKESKDVIDDWVSRISLFTVDDFKAWCDRVGARYTTGSGNSSSP